MRQPDEGSAGAAAHAVLTALEDPHTAVVFLVGPLGSGKSFVLHRAASTRRTPGTGNTTVAPTETPAPAPVLVRPMVRTRDLTLGALLGPALAADLGSATGGETAPGPRVLMIDDVDRLDDASLSLLSQGLDRGLVRLVAGVRSSSSARVFQELRCIGRTVVVDVEPWRASDVDDFVAGQLGGRLHPLTRRRLLELSAGNALCLTELLQGDDADGHLVLRHGLWVWSGPLAVPPVTEARVVGELDRLVPEVRSVLTSAALAAPVPVRVLEGLHGGQAVEAADAAGLLWLGDVGGTLSVRPRSVLQGRVVVQVACTTRRRKVADVVLRSLGPDRVPEPLAVSVGRLAVGAQAWLPADLARPLAAAALGAHDAVLSEQVLARSPDAGVGADTASALIGQGEFRRAAEVLGTAPGEERRAAVLLMGVGEPAAWRAWSTRSRSGPADPGGYLAAGRAWTGAGLEALLADEAGTSATGGERRGARGRALVGLVAAVAQAGRLGEAVARAEAADSHGFEPVDRLHLLAVLGACQLARGALAEGARHGHRLRELGLAEGWPDAYRLGTFLAGYAALQSGDVASAEWHLAESAACEGGHTAAATAELVPGCLALARAMAGRYDDAETTLAAAGGGVPRPMPQAVQDRTRLLRAEVALLSGRRHGAHDAAARVADRCQDAGQVLLALEALHLCARSRSSTETARRLAGLAARTDFDLAATYVAHAEASATSDGARLTRVACDYERRGLGWLAGETAAGALALGLAGPSRRALWTVECRSVLDRLQLRAGLVVPPSWWNGSDPVSPLTDREREIVELAAAGWSSPRIAAHLQVSQRTVENHLQHSYRKLGISGRPQLPAALGYPAGGLGRAGPDR